VRGQGQRGVADAYVLISADVNVNLLLHRSAHVVEVQIHHAALVEWESHEHSHEYVRVSSSVRLARFRGFAGVPVDTILRGFALSVS
jgi:hypothetical protein